jgi:hypothetical protein
VVANLNQKNPHVRREFDHYTGYECWVGVYRFPAGHHLRLEAEKLDLENLDGPPAMETLLDRTVTELVHLEGKAAIWQTLFEGSQLERTIRGHWPDLLVVECDEL